MDRFDCNLDALADKAGRGEPLAQVHFREEVEPQLQRIVRYTLKRGVGTSTLDRRILAEARRLRHAGWYEDSEELAGQIARNLCRQVLNRLPARRAPQPLFETI